MKVLTAPDNTMPRIAAVGMYDGVHRGHRYLIDYLNAEARARGLESAVVTFSRHPMATIRPDAAPLLLGTLEERVALLDRAGAETCILLAFNEKMRHLSARDFLRLLRDNYGVKALVMGFNNRIGHEQGKDFDYYKGVAAGLGMEIFHAPEYRGVAAPVSSTIVRRHLAGGDVKAAARGLGRMYSLTGVVESGQRLGRTLGFPTANMRIDDPSLAVPRQGVYAVRVTTPDGVRRNGMANIGCRPTVSIREHPEVTTEVHVMDFNGYLYDDVITVDFADRLRDERRFDSVDDLRAQLEKDKVSAKKLLEGVE